MRIPKTDTLYTVFCAHSRRRPLRLIKSKYTQHIKPRIGQLNAFYSRKEKSQYRGWWSEAKRAACPLSRPKPNGYKPFVWKIWSTDHRHPSMPSQSFIPLNSSNLTSALDCGRQLKSPIELHSTPYRSCKRPMIRDMSSACFVLSSSVVHSQCVPQARKRLPVARISSNAQTTTR